MLAAGWSWRLLVLGVVAYPVVRVLALLWLVLVPIVVALLVTAPVRPLAVLLRRRLPGPFSALVTLLRKTDRRPQAAAGDPMRSRTP